MNKVVFSKQIKVKGIEFAYSEEEYANYEVISGKLVYFTKKHREVFPVRNRRNIKKLVRLLNELEEEHQFQFQKGWSGWKDILYEGWDIRENDGELEISSQAPLKGSANLVKVSIPIDGGDPICIFRYCDGLKTYWSQFNHLILE